MTRAATTSATGNGRRRRPGLRLAALVSAVLGVTVVACTQPAESEPAGYQGNAFIGADPVAAASTDPFVDEDLHARFGAEADVPAPLPVAVEIPLLDVHADLVPLGINDDGSMQVPEFGRAGWYANGPRPGAQGPSVIAAHYDSRDGPDVFYELGTLEPGDEVQVHGTDGSKVTFVVDRVEQHPKDELPGGRIWAVSDEPRLTLITCGGVFDRSTGHYTDNAIVYTTLAP